LDIPINYENSWKFHLLIKRGNFYIHANYQKIESNIFPRFYSFYRTYTKIFIIFGSVHDFLYKIKHQAFLNQKKKDNNTLLLRPARLASAQAGPRVQPALLPSLKVADGEVPPVSSFSLTCGGSAATLAAVGGVSAHAKVRNGAASASRSYCHHPNMLYSLPSILATQMAGGRHSRSQTGR